MIYLLEDFNKYKMTQIKVLNIDNTFILTHSTPSFSVSSEK